VQNPEQQLRQYSAKLLFQFRPVRKGVSPKHRLCEERIVTFAARSPKSALSKAKRYGKSEEFTSSQSDVRVHFEFVGLLELLDVTNSYSAGEVWYDLVERVQPRERRSRIIPPEHELDALTKSGPRRGRRLKIW
jgi:hypothetical protein